MTKALPAARRMAVQSSYTCVRGKRAVENAVEVSSVDGNVPVEVSVSRGWQNHFTYDAGVTVCAVSSVPECKAHLFLPVTLHPPQQVVTDFAVKRLSDENAMNHLASQIRRMWRLM